MSWLGGDPLLPRGTAVASEADVVLMFAGAGRMVACVMPVTTLIQSPLPLGWVDDIRTSVVTEMDASDADLIDGPPSQATKLEHLLGHQEGVGGTCGLERLFCPVVELNPTIFFGHMRKALSSLC